MIKQKKIFSLFFLIIGIGIFSQKKQPDFSKDPSYPEFKTYLDKIDSLIDTENDSIYIYIDKANLLAKKMKNYLGEVKVLEAKGSYELYVKNNYNEAQNIFLNCIKKSETHQLNCLGDIYHSLGKVFHMSDNYKKAKHYYKLSYDYAQKEKDTSAIVLSLSSLGTIHYREENYSEAENYFKKSLSYPSSNTIKNIIFSNLCNMKISEEKYDEAENYAVKAIKHNPIKGGDAIDYSRLLDAKNGLKNYTGIDTILKNSKLIFEKSTSLRDKTIILASISITHYNLGEFKQAADDKDQYIDLFYDLKTKERDDVVYEMEAKYQTQKKEEEIKKQIEQKEKLYYYIGISLLLILILSYLVFLNIKQKKKLNTQKNQLQLLVDEKNTLLKETHHRVKNSFQIVSSLLYLQSENIQDKEAALAVKEAQNRVKSMILIHQKLYSKDQLIGIDSKEYLEDLVDDIIQNQSFSIENLTVTKNCESYVFSIDTITPMGLIVNELITNVIKYAFPEKHPNPELMVSFMKKNNGLELQVADNGTGIKNQENKNSFGLKLVNSLAKKLKATVTFENKNGTTITLFITKFEELQ